MEPSDFSGLGDHADFAMGKVRGLRGFATDSLGRLTGINYKKVWLPTENIAVCLARPVYADPYASTIVGTNAWSVTGSITASTTRGRMGTKQNIADPEPEHQMKGCGCGFYAYYDGSNDYGVQAPVVGIVEGYGEVIVGTRGFRAQKAKIVALHFPEKDYDPDMGVQPLNKTARARIAHNYQDIPQFEDYEMMVEAFPPMGGPNDLTPETDPQFWTRWPQI